MSKIYSKDCQPDLGHIGFCGICSFRAVLEPILFIDTNLLACAQCRAAWAAAQEEPELPLDSGA